MSARNEIPGFGARLKGLRESAGLSQVKLAEAAGTHADSVVKLENGARSPSLELAGRIAEALGISVADLLPPGTPGAAKRNPKKSGD